MLRSLVVFIAALALAAPVNSASPALLHLYRESPGDLEVGGALAGLPPGSTRYIRYQELLALPQEKYNISDDTNLTSGANGHGAVEIEGVPLATLAGSLGSTLKDPMIIAICYDKYRSNYPQDYLAAHHPLLVLRINGKLRDQWPQADGGGTMGPYLISHPTFTPSFKVLSHQDEPQIPYGITRIEVRSEAVVFGAIKPRGSWPIDSPVQQGYTIARQDCFRCHNMGAQGGVLAGRSWLQLARVASTDSIRFRKIIYDPASVMPGAKMPAHKDYDEATRNALTAYFQTFNAVPIPPVRSKQ